MCFTSQHAHLISWYLNHCSVLYGAVSIALGNLIYQIVQRVMKRNQTGILTAQIQLETIWTWIPVVYILATTGNALIILYGLESAQTDTSVIRVVGSQWNWTADLSIDDIPVYDLVANSDGVPVPDGTDSGTNADATSTAVTNAGSTNADMTVTDVTVTDSTNVDSDPTVTADSDNAKKDVTCHGNPDTIGDRIDATRTQRGQLRLAAAEQPIFASNQPTAVILTSLDVIHGWSMPLLGIRTDCIPGRTTVISIHAKEGTYTGFCSELCGVGHAFMPITLIVSDTAAESSLTSQLPATPGSPDTPNSGLFPGLSDTVRPQANSRAVEHRIPLDCAYPQPTRIYRDRQQRTRIVSNVRTSRIVRDLSLVYRSVLPIALV